MAGIGGMMQRGPAPSAPTAPQSAGRPQPGDEQSAAGAAGEEASPEEQAQYDQFMDNAGEIIFPDGEQGPEISPNITQALKGSEDPIMNLATAAITIVTQLRDSAKKAGAPVSDDVLWEAGSDIVGMLADVANDAKIHEYSEEEIEKAWYMALDLYRTAGEQSGDVDTEALKQSFGEMQMADKEGRLAEFAPALAEQANKVQKQGA